MENEELKKEIKEELQNDEEQVEGEVLPEVELNNNPKPVEEEQEECCPDCEGKNLDPVPEQVMTEEQEAVEKMLTQSQVNEIIGRTRKDARESALRSVYDRYGVQDENGLDEIVGNGQRYPMLEETMNNEKKASEDRISELEKQLGDLTTELALFRSDINPDRYEDVKLILRGKGLDINNENITNEMGTHPEWKKEDPKAIVEEKFKKVEPEEPVSKISRLGNDKPVAQSDEDIEKNAAMNLFDIYKK